MGLFGYWLGKGVIKNGNNNFLQGL